MGCKNPMTAHTAHIAISTGNTASLPFAGFAATVAANKYGAMKGPKFINGSHDAGNERHTAFRSDIARRVLSRREEHRASEPQDEHADRIDDRVIGEHAGNDADRRKRGPDAEQAAS